MSEKQHSPNNNLKPNLVDVMHRIGFDADELTEKAFMMGYNQDGELNDLDIEEVISRLSGEILADPRTVLMRLPFMDLVVLQMMKDIPPDGYFVAPRTNLIMAMAKIGLALQLENEGDNANDDILVVAEDFRKACIPIIDEVLENEYVIIRSTIERLLIGIINIYGALSESELFELLKIIFKEDKDMDLVDQIMSESIAFFLMETYSYEKDEYYYMSPFALDLDDVLYDIDKRPDIKSFKPFDTDTMAEAGDMPIPTLPNPYNNRIMEILQNRFGYTKSDALAMRLIMWQDVQENDMAVGKIIQQVIERSPKKDIGGGIEMLNSAIQDISNYLNHTPRWKFKGHCPADLAVIGDSAPKVVIGPNMRRSGFDLKNVQQMIDKAWTNRKVGRNDPCPCGSGKKYKNCCGKGY